MVDLSPMTSFGSQKRISCRHREASHESACRGSHLSLLDPGLDDPTAVSVGGLDARPAFRDFLISAGLNELRGVSKSLWPEGTVPGPARCLRHGHDERVGRKVCVRKPRTRSSDGREVDLPLGRHFS